MAAPVSAAGPTSKIHIYGWSTRVLDRLLEENHQRYAAEKAAGLHEKGAGKKAKKRVAKPAPQGEGLFDVE
ncbi:hypothetical protein GCM10009716_23650 [Streptomyces sodiiphilus]|uniref:Uncharacterized protein n=1 Tax=Streptomyces sodiiphilus TaxID=226217 RepID=A0ABN2P5U0_9ACTN